MIENTKKLPLKDMPEDEAVEIFKAWRNGDKLEAYTGVNIWVSVGNPQYALHSQGIYRIASRPPSFDNWHLLPEWARFIAQGQNGGVFIFENEPARSNTTWLIRSGEASLITNFRLGYNPGTGGWENSMIEKPEGGER